MESVLKDIRLKLKGNYYVNEEHVRLSLVSRILLELGWNIWNPKQVNCEFITVPKEDSTRVDIALFKNEFAPPSVYIEIKSVGKIEYGLSNIETQLRDYNRNNTSMFTILTDGRKWRFYYSQTGGEFARKCFKVIDLIEDDLEDIESSLTTFLSKSEIVAENAKTEAESYLQLSQKQRALEDALPKARRSAMEAPFPSLPEALINITSKSGYSVSKDEAILFIKNSAERPETRTKTSKNIQNFSSKSKLTTVKTGKKNFLPPNHTQCKFNYKGNEYIGSIQNGKIIVEGYGSFTSFSSASGKITNTSRNGWLDWELKVPGTNQWILADSWREK